MSVDPRALGRAALLGTGGGGATVPPTGTPADALLVGREDEPIERRLLLTAGARSFLRRGGTVAPDAPDPPSAAPPESRPACSDQAAARFRDILRSHRSELLPEALHLLDERGLRLPFASIPEALSLCPKAGRERMARVVGERGRWLALHNSAWSWVAPEGGLPAAVDTDPEALRRTFDEGRLDDRVLALGRLRELDPAAARGVLQAGWANEKAGDRALLLSALAVGLSPADEPMLENLRTGGNARLRAEALALLGRLPEAAYGRRMAERARSILRVTVSEVRRKGMLASLLRKTISAPSLEVVLPKELPDAWKDDGIRDEIKPGMGRKMSWAYQVLKLVPPSSWAGDVTPAACVRLFDAEHWPLMLAVTEAVNARAVTAWAGALFDIWQTLPQSDPAVVGYVAGAPADLVALLSGAQLAERVRPMLEGPGHGVWVRLLEAWDGPWPDDVARLWLDGVRSALGRIGTQAAGDEYWQRSLPLAARKLPFGLLNDRVPRLPAVGTEGLRSTRRAWQQAKDTFNDHLATRIDFRRALDGLPPAPLGEDP